MAENTMQTAFLFLYTETSLHAGTGSTVSVVDLPIQRERTTQYPLVQGSGVKGALRSQSNADNTDAVMLFGPDTVNADAHAGAISVGDARIVLFPVRSLAGVFAYVTCPAVLARLSRDAAFAGVGNFPTIPSVTGEQAVVTSKSSVTARGNVVLEEFSFKPQAGADEIAQWLAGFALPGGKVYGYWREKLTHSLVIVSDDAFRDFVVNSTEVTTRVRLDAASKTVQRGALWTQESLPSDVLMVSTIISSGSRSGSDATAQDVQTRLMDTTPPRIQLGGDETTGQGFVALHWLLP